MRVKSVFNSTATGGTTEHATAMAATAATATATSSACIWAPPYSQQPPRAQQPPYVQQPVTQSPENETIIFVCGILGFFLGPIPIIIALVMGKDYNKANNYGGSEKIR